MNRKEGEGVSVTQMPVIVQGMPVTAETAETAPRYEAGAAALLKRCREFYEDPENERAFQEWMAKRNEKKNR